MNITKTITDNEIAVSTEKDRYGRTNWLYTKRYFFQTKDKRAAMISTTVNLVKLPKRQGYLVANWGRGAAAPVKTFETLAAAREFAITDLLEVHDAAVLVAGIDMTAARSWVASNFENVATGSWSAAEVLDFITEYHVNGLNAFKL